MAKKIKVGLKKQTEKIILFRSGNDMAINEIGNSHISFTDNKKVQIEGCKSVIDYSENFITLNIGKKTLLLFGSDLEILDFTDNNIIITGIISSLEFGE